MEFLDTVLGAAIAGLGFFVGRAFPRRRIYQEPKPICGCGHHYSFHTDGFGCNKRSPNYNDKKQGYVCGCQQYSGPTPIDTYTAEF